MRKLVSSGEESEHMFLQHCLDLGYIIVQVRDQGCYPVFLTDAEIDLYYNGFCNDTLWPLFHYITPSTQRKWGEGYSTFLIVHFTVLSVGIYFRVH